MEHLGPVGPGASDSEVAVYVTGDGPTQTALDSRFVQPLQLQPPVASAVTVTDESTNPRPTESFGGFFWATGSAGQIYKSTDGAAWTSSVAPAPFD